MNTDSLITNLEKQLLECQLFSVDITDLLRETEVKVKSGEIHIDVLIKAIDEITETSKDQNKTIKQRNKTISKINKKLSRKIRDQWLYYGAGAVFGTVSSIGLFYLVK